MATQFPEPAQPIDTIEDEINQFFDKIIVCVDYRRKTLIVEANEKKEEQREKLKKKEQSEQHLLALKAETQRKLKENFLQETQEIILKDLEDKLAELRLHQPETHLKFKGNSKQVEQLILGLGEVFEREVVPVVPRYQDMKVTVAVGNGGLRDGELLCPEAIAIDPNTGNIYVTQGVGFIPKSGKVSIFSQSGKFIKCFGHMNCLSGIAIHGNFVYVSDMPTNTVYQFKLGTDIRLVNSAGGLGSEDGKFDYPGHICVSTNGGVYVTDVRNNRIQILNSSLHFLRKFSHQSLNSPYDIKLTEDEVYVISISSQYVIGPENSQIHVFSYTGEKIRSLTGIFQARYFCIDADKNVIISDRGDNCVKVFSAQGTLLHKVGKLGVEKGMLQTPNGVALTKDLKLVVVSGNFNYALQIFSC